MTGGSERCPRAPSSSPRALPLRATNKRLRLVPSGPPDIRLTRLVEEGDIVVAEGTAQAAPVGGGRIDALFCDVFHSRDDKICRLVTYQVDRHRDHETLRAFEP